MRIPLCSIYTNFRDVNQDDCSAFGNSDSTVRNRAEYFIPVHYSHRTVTKIHQCLTYMTTVCLNFEQCV